ncbi:MAG: SLC13 family permease [Anaerolineae bacterium]
MSFEAAFTLLLLLATLVVMGSQRLRADLVALIVMALLIVSGIVDPVQAFAAFGQPVIIIVACVYVLGAALFETGVATIIAGPILRIGGHGTTALLLVIMLVATALTSVLDGMLVVALLLPAVLRIARATGISRSVLLLPLATAATLGSHLTLIGTASNLVVSDVLAASGQPPLGLLSLTPYAAVVMVLMTLWFLGPGRKLLDKPMPEEQAAPTLGEVAVAYGLDNQLYLLRVRAESSLVGYRLDAVSLRARFGLNILAVQPARDPRITPATPDLVLEQGDLLYVQAAPGELHQAANRLALEVKRPAALEELAGVDEEALRMAEVMIPVRSPLIGKTLAAGWSAGASRRFGAGRAAPVRGDPGWTGDVAPGGWRHAVAGGARRPDAHGCPRSAPGGRHRSGAFARRRNHRKSPSDHCHRGRPGRGGGVKSPVVGCGQRGRRVAADPDRLRQR